MISFETVVTKQMINTKLCCFTVITMLNYAVNAAFPDQ